jgi:alpha-L-fucosidase
VLWFDTPELTTLKQSIELEMFVKRLQPDCIVNTRVGNEVGDYKEMEDNSIPMGGINQMWETPATMAESWGYSVLDTKEYWKSSTELIRKLVEITSKGGNYLLNIGPDASGKIPPMSMQRLKDIQEWMKVNSESIYGTEPAQLPALYGGCYTKKGNILYVHFFEHPESGTLRLPVDGDSISDVALLTVLGEKKLKFQSTNGKGTLVQVPTSLPFKSASVIKVSLR